MIRPAAFRRTVLRAAAGLGALLLMLAAATLAAYQDPPSRLAPDDGAFQVQVLDRAGEPLHHSYRNRWNATDQLELHAVPVLLRDAFVISEDGRFYSRSGPDWRARGAAVWQAVRARRVVRGASTITEQVVRLWHPRPRTVWSRWLEGFEARGFEARFTKAEILEFYLNQLPFAANRRGLVQAARYWFDRDLDTLSRREMLALVVLARAPGRFDRNRDVGSLDRSITDLVQRLVSAGSLPATEASALLDEPIQLASATPPVEASHFVEHVTRRTDGSAGGVVVTTLDAGLQRRVQALLDGRLTALDARGVGNGAALVYDHLNDEVLAWVVGGAADETTAGRAYDTVTTPRQPGSTLKPFVYARAMERGWTAATLIDDSPLAESVGGGVHQFRNYSRSFHGPITLREALGNSLNVPAVRAARFVGSSEVLGTLREFGFESLTEDAGHYGDGIALGDGAVTLAELVQGYATLARGGLWRPLRAERGADRPSRRVLSPEVASIIGDVLSDPRARRLEFGAAPLLRMPVQTAVKTGTSSDHHDAWAVGYDWRYTVGVWMGNLDGTRTDDVTGSSGPSVVLRSVFADLTRDAETQPLWQSPRLVTRAVCLETGALADGRCASRVEHFVPGTEPQADGSPAALAERGVRLESPQDGLMLALDPRVPDALESYRFSLDAATVDDATRVEWWLDGRLVASTAGPSWDWPVAQGEHAVRARVWRRSAADPVETAAVGFAVR